MGWHCPNCGTEQRTTHTRPHTPFHRCPRLGGLLAPLVPGGTRAKVQTAEREDYLGHEQAPTVDGRPVMAVVTTRDDGQDCAVYVPPATARSEES